MPLPLSWPCTGFVVLDMLTTQSTQAWLNLCAYYIRFSVFLFDTNILNDQVHSHVCFQSHVIVFCTKRRSLSLVVVRRQPGCPVDDIVKKRRAFKIQEKVTIIDGLNTFNLSIEEDCSLPVSLPFLAVDLEIFQTAWWTNSLWFTPLSFFCSLNNSNSYRLLTTLRKSLKNSRRKTRSCLTVSTHADPPYWFERDMVDGEYGFSRSQAPPVQTWSSSQGRVGLRQGEGPPQIQIAIQQTK